MAIVTKHLASFEYPTGTVTVDAEINTTSNRLVALEVANPEGRDIFVEVSGTTYNLSDIEARLEQVNGIKITKYIDKKAPDFGLLYTIRVE